MEEIVGSLIQQIDQGRSQGSLTHDELQRAIGQLLQQSGAVVAYAVPFADVGLTPGEGVFDVVATGGEVPTLVEVYSDATEDSLEVMRRHIDALRVSSVRGKLFLAVDILDSVPVALGALKDAVKRLMVEHDMGVMLVDIGFAMVCHNYDQLILDEMPELLYLRG